MFTNPDINNRANALIERDLQRVRQIGNEKWDELFMTFGHNEG